MKKSLSKFFAFFGFRILKSSTYLRLIKTELDFYKSSRMLNFKTKFENSIFDKVVLDRALSEVDNSKAQLFQDIACLMHLKFKKGGFFVEFGASDGVRYSNTYLLEKDYGWSGILAEPAKRWHNQLRQNRSSVIDTRCVYRSTGEILKFNETTIGELSTIYDYSFSDAHAEFREQGETYAVETVSLNDLLDQNAAPRVIDFLSIDTEGSEFEILRSVDFDKYSFNFISCEHNFSSNRERIFKLLISNGYQQVCSEQSEFDDWYVHNSLL